MQDAGELIATTAAGRVPDQLTANRCERYIAALTNVQTAYDKWLAPVDGHRLTNKLADFADMLQVSTPTDGGLELYLAALEGMPANLLDQAALHVARTHKFARLPQPHDFLAAIAGEMEWIAQQRVWPRFVLDYYLRMQATLNAEPRKDL